MVESYARSTTDRVRLSFVASKSRNGIDMMSHPAYQNTGKRSRDESRRCIFEMRISHVYTLSVK